MSIDTCHCGARYDTDTHQEPSCPKCTEAEEAAQPGDVLGVSGVSAACSAHQVSMSRRGDGES